MRAVIQDQFGGPEVLHLADRPLPDPLPTEVRVRVAAAGINPVDWKTRAGKGMASLLGELPFTVGWDVSGVIDAVGRGVTRFQVGDEVFGMPWFPRQAAAYAEAVTAPSRHFALKPKSADFVHAAALPLAVLTAWQMLVGVAEVESGQTVLIHGGAGGVGHLAVQIAKARGATVIATARKRSHQFLASLGVDEAIDYTDVDFASVLNGLDVVIDLVGGENAERSVAVLGPGGILISVNSGITEKLLARAAERNVRASGFLVEPDRADLDEISRLVDVGHLRVRVDEVFPLVNAAAAHAAGELGGRTGKLVLEVS